MERNLMKGNEALAGFKVHVHLCHFCFPFLLRNPECLPKQVKCIPMGLFYFSSQNGRIYTSTG